MAQKPETVFCKILEIQYNTAIDAIESVINIPFLVLRDVKSNISRVERLIYNTVYLEVQRIEKQVIEILFLNGIRDLENNNFCRVAFACSKLVEALVDSSNHYLDFLPASTRSALSGNYDLFERNVCVLGLQQLINQFTSNALADLRTRLLALRDEMEDQLRLSELTAMYQAALDEEILNGSSIIELLDDLRGFSNCAFETCNYAATVSNKVDDYAEKLALADVGGTFVLSINSLLDGYNEKNDALNTKIDEIIALLDTGRPPTVSRDQIMFF